jgi:DnaK suppressor protein
MMDAEKLAHYREILTRQLRQHTEMVRDNQSDALEMAAADDGVKDVADMSVQDVSQEIEYRLSERASQTVADIDQALLRIDEGSYGVCGRCGKDIPERRLDALPTARYDAECQTLIEQASGEDDYATL